MGFMDKIKNIKNNVMGTNQIDDDEYYDDNDAESGDDFVDVENDFGVTDDNSYSGFEGSVDISSNSSVYENVKTKITVVLFKPHAYDSVLSDMAKELKKENAILINLEDTSKEMSRRIIDFISGVAFAQDGNIKKIATNTYIVTPNGVDVKGEALADELANINAVNGESIQYQEV